jgi:diadenosine tetraphosphate (Ap4A) HIT family hydrolase
MTTTCPLCRGAQAAQPERSNELVAAFDDGFPLNPGHTLVVPRRHVGRVLELTESEHRELFMLARRELRRLEYEFGPDAFTFGVNDGPVAGQTIAHVHLHVIPRAAGDNPAPKGGVRWVVPERAAYWDE